MHRNQPRQEFQSNRTLHRVLVATVQSHHQSWDTPAEMNHRLCGEDTNQPMDTEQVRLRLEYDYVPQ